MSAIASNGKVLHPKISTASVLAWDKSLAGGPSSLCMNSSFNHQPQNSLQHTDSGCAIQG